MPNWVGPAVALLGIVGGFVGWLIRQWVIGEIERRVREATDEALEKLDTRMTATEKDITKMQAQRTGDLEVYNVKLGQLDVTQSKHEARCDQRFTDLERITGRSRRLRGDS